MREIMTAQEWIAKGYPYVFEGTQGSFDFVRMDDYDFEDNETKKLFSLKTVSTLKVTGLNRRQRRTFSTKSLDWKT